MKNIVVWSALIVSTVACQRSSDLRHQNASSRIKGKVNDATAEKPADGPPASSPAPGPSPLLGRWASPCSLLVPPNKVGMVFYTRQVNVFTADGKVSQTAPAFTDDTCKTAADEALLKTYFSGTDLPAEEASKQIAFILATREKTYTTGAMLYGGSVLELNLSSSKGEMLYTSVAMGLDKIIFAADCPQVLFDQKKCTELSGESAEKRAKKIDNTRTFFKSPS